MREENITMDVQNSIMWAPAESDCLQRLQRQIQSKQKGQHTNIHNKDTFVNPTTNLIRELIYLCRENRTISIFSMLSLLAFYLAFLDYNLKKCC